MARVRGIDEPRKKKRGAHGRMQKVKKSLFLERLYTPITSPLLFYFTLMRQHTHSDAEREGRCARKCVFLKK